MSNYTKATNFATKDSLATGNPGKIVKGTEIDTEFNAISSAISTKADVASPSLTGVPTAPTATVGTDTSQIATTAFVQDALATVGLTGRVVQIVTSKSTSYIETFSDSYYATGHTATITPQKSANKILILVSAGFAQTNAYANNGANAFMTLYRGGTNLASGSGGFADSFVMANVNTINSQSNIYTHMALTHLDSPNTTSATTYQPYVKRGSNAGSGYNQHGNATITLLEIEQ